MKKKPPRAKIIDLGPLPGLAGYALRRAQLAVFRDFDRVFAKSGIRPAQYSALCVIERNPCLTQSAVAGALGIKRANFTVLFNTLEARGLAKRGAGMGDRRSHALTLTPAGAAFTARLHALARAHERGVCKTLTPAGRRRLFDTLNTLRTASEPGE